MSRKILMIDDDPQLVDVVGKYLKLKGIQFDGISLPDQAVTKACAAKPDAILLDIGFPSGRSGWDVCRAIKGNDTLRHIPVIMISGKRMSPEDKARAIELGAEDHLSKPFDLPTLLLKLEAILRVSES